MQLAPDFSSSLPSSAGEAAYRALQWGKNYFGLAHKLTSTRAATAWADVLRTLQGSPAGASQAGRLSPATIAAAQARYDALLTLDWQDAEAGYYPSDLLFDQDWSEFARVYPQVWVDLVSISDRVVNKRYQEFAADIDTEGYPSYYLQNFHHQTDGYLSDRSASLYDVQVDLLFGGCTDAMRRRIIRPIIDLATRRPDKTSRILDVACGTGRTLRMLRRAFPKSALHGIDLSPAYLRKANQTLSAMPGELP
ncbi:MAG: class I SAM-dependent methyltransferase, partial [Cyanobacteria bacterium J06639_1]